MRTGRPSEYKPGYCANVDEYLDWCKDEQYEVRTYEGEHSTGYQTRTRVKLPTIEGFAQYIGVPRRTVFDWRDQFPDFSHSLDKILTEQQKRLIDSGLSGDYNSTIAKLILSSNHGMREKSDVTSDGKELKGNTIVFKDFDAAGGQP